MKTFQSITLIIGLAGACVCLLALFARSLAAPTWDALKRFAGLDGISKAVAVIVAIGFIHYGATKGIKFSNGIKDGEQKSTLTNNSVNISWQRDTSGGIIVPTTATVYIDYKLDDTNVTQWVNLGESYVGAWGWTGTVVTATSYTYHVWAYYIPPEPVHTNGVWVYKTLKDRRDNNPLPLRARVEVNGKAISTPKEKRNDNAD